MAETTAAAVPEPVVLLPDDAVTTPAPPSTSARIFGSDSCFRIPPKAKGEEDVTEDNDGDGDDAGFPADVVVIVMVVEGEGAVFAVETNLRGDLAVVPLPLPPPPPLANKGVSGLLGLPAAPAAVVVETLSVCLVEVEPCLL